MDISRLALAAMGASTLGCSSTYMPRPSPRVSLVMDSGSYAYVRDGKKYEGGLFGGDLDEAVKGNPEAEHYASAYKGGIATGFVLSLVGAVGIGVGAGVAGSELANQPPGSSSVPVTGLVVMGAGLLVSIIGDVVILNAAPHLFDAINAYNDGLQAAAPPAPAQAPAPATPAGQGPAVAP
jgi:hypothetical protein